MNDVSANPIPVIVIPKTEKYDKHSNKVPLSELGRVPMDKEQIQAVLAQIKNNPDFRLERNPDSDAFGEPTRFCDANLMAFKAPSAGQVIDGLKVATTVIGLLTEVVRNGRELSDVVTDWFRANPDKSDKEKSATMKMAFALANQMELEDQTQGRRVA